MDFSSRLLSWYYKNYRPLPWRSSSDPYIIWISEVILQQTRMEQGIVFFNRFIHVFPTVYDLAKASEDRVLRAWQGLGYYSRARSLHASAREIVANRQGVFPETYAEWIELKGIGPYTAAAISSIAYGEAVPAIDGNVYRVLSRLLAIDKCIDTSAGKKVFKEVAESLLTEYDPGGFNQAIMDFGSLVCKPVSPTCNDCLFNRECLTYRRNAVSTFPVRKPKRKAVSRYFNYFYFFFFNDDGHTMFYVRQRSGDDIWKNLYELPLLETKSFVSEAELTAHPWWTELFPADCGCTFYHTPVAINHKLTHQTIHARFYRVMVDPLKISRLEARFLCSSLDAFEEMAKPRLIERFMEKESLTTHPS